jgi:hypothetical protein
LEHGIRIAGVVASYITLGVDRPSDVPLAERVLREDETQRSLMERTLAMGATR